MNSKISSWRKRHLTAVLPFVKAMCFTSFSVSSSRGILTITWPLAILVTTLTGNPSSGRSSTFKKVSKSSSFLGLFVFDEAGSRFSLIFRGFLDFGAGSLGECIRAAFFLLHTGLHLFGVSNCPSLHSWAFLFCIGHLRSQGWMHVAVPRFWLSLHKDCNSARRTVPCFEWVWCQFEHIRLIKLLHHLSSMLGLNFLMKYEPYLALKLQPQNRQFSFGDMSTQILSNFWHFDKCEVFTCACLQRKWNSTSVALPDWRKCLRHDRYSSGCFSNFLVLLAVPPSQPKI